MNAWKVESFGADCLGNISGYRVSRYVWVPRPWSGRRDGLSQELEIAATFVGNIYRNGSFEKAKTQADALCASLNA